MSWAIPLASDVMSEFTPAERDSFSTLLGGDPDVSGNTFITPILGRTVNEIRDYIRSGNYDIDLDNPLTIPLGLFNDAIAICRWRFLVANPQFKQFQTDERKALYDAAIAKLKLIAQQQFIPDSPTDDEPPARSAMWNSENKLLMRTHPVPRPGTQFTPQDGTYANPDAPADQS